MYSMHPKQILILVVFVAVFCCKTRQSLFDFSIFYDCFVHVHTITGGPIALHIDRFLDGCQKSERDEFRRS